MNLGETLSSDTLFHFTSKREYLENIIERGFYPRYSTEDFSMFSSVPDSTEKIFDFGVPMVCFCDIPLSKVKEHISVYKGYGIGCTKAWGIERGVTPLVYVKPTSETVQGIQKALITLRNLSYVNEEDGKMNGPVIRGIRESLNRLKKFIKPYEGRFEHNGQVFESKRFYDEREWRFVPNLFEDDKSLLHWIEKDLLQSSIQLAKGLIELNWPNFMPGDAPWVQQKLKSSPDLLNFPEKELAEKLYEMLRQEMNEKIESMPEMSLPIDPLTIKYIIVEKEEDVEPIVDLLGKRFKDYSHATVKRLLTRIITLEQITDDF